MAKTQNPVSAGVVGETLRWAQSVHKILNGAVDMGVPTGSKDSTGNYSEFSQGNGSGVLIRIGASGSVGVANKWTTTGTAITINHGLQRQPIGVHLVNSDKQLQIWQPTTPTTVSIFLAPSDATANATVYVF
jgi:hypothetical protein